MSGQEIGVGIVGLGRIGATHAIALAEVDRLTTHDRDTWNVPLGPTCPASGVLLHALREGRAPAIDTASSLLATRVALLAQVSADAGGRPQSWPEPRA